MRIPVLTAVLVSLTTPLYAGVTTHTGILLSIKNDTIVLLEAGGRKRSLEYNKYAACFIKGEQVSCDNIARNSIVRVDCPTGKACARIIVDSGPK